MPRTPNRKADVSVVEFERRRCPTCGSLSRSAFREIEFPVIAPHGPEGTARTINAFQAPPKYIRVLELLYSHPDTPWHTQSDVLRAFLDYGCRYFGPVLAGTSKVLGGLLHTIRMMNGIVDRAREANDLAQLIDQLDREVQRMVDGGLRESAVGLVYQHRELARQLDDKIMRRKLVGDINQRFAYLLKGTQGRKAGEQPSAKIGVDHDAEHEHSDREDEDEDNE